MKNVFTRSALVLLVSAALFSCQKEQETLITEQSTTRDLGNGIIETTQKGGPNGGGVIFSNWIQKTDPDWTAWGTDKWTTDMNTTSLTDAIRDNGLVLVYFNFNGFISQLPHHSLGQNLLLDYYFATGKITARYTYGGGAVAGDILNIKFRYILIPSAAFNGPGGRMSEVIDYSDYNAVCEYYGIQK